jgi:hypothetical protein
MNVIRWTAGAFLILAMAALLAAAQGGQELDITGYYNEKDGEFTRITRNGDLYQFLQRYKVGDWVGVAIRQDDRLSVAWQRSDGANLGSHGLQDREGRQGADSCRRMGRSPGQKNHSGHAEVVKKARLKFLAEGL